MKRYIIKTAGVTCIYQESGIDIYIYKFRGNWARKMVMSNQIILDFIPKSVLESVYKIKL